jgi:hypothetical protein
MARRVTPRIGSRSLNSMEDVSKWSRSFAKSKGLNRETAQELFEVLMDAYNSSRTGRLGIVKVTALAMQFIGIAMEAVDEELHLG